MSREGDRVIEDGLGEDRAIPSRRWPGLRLVSAVRMAFDARKLIVAAVGILLLQLGWSLLDLAFIDSADVTPDLLPRRAVTRASEDFSWSFETINRLTGRLFEPIRILTTPLFALFDPQSRCLRMLHALLGTVWLIVVWGYCGGAIARIASVEQAESRRPGIAAAVRFAWQSGPALILTPCCPMIALAFCMLTGLGFGLLYRVVGGAAVAGTLLVIPLLAGLVMTLLVAALIAGWPFFHAALATGADDALDALSRTYGYINQRLILFAAGIFIAWATGLVGLALVDLLASGVIRLTQWSLSLSGPSPRISAWFWRIDLNRGTFALAAHRFWLGGVRLLAQAWVFSYFWTAATLIYLWLRQEVDGTPPSVIDRPRSAAPTA
jgi:hypothetical protein